jgi:5-methylcytosine-specific restriction endonuclease McrA
MPSGLSTIHMQLINALRKHPEGLTSGQWRKELGIRADEQMQLDRRKRDLYKWFHIEKRLQEGQLLYIYKGERKTPLVTEGISLKLRAEILNASHGKCGMCGRTIKKHGVTLVIDHRIPKDWDGTDDRDNLWAICEDCNQGKKNFFASQNQSLMRRVMSHSSVHMRLGELLKAHRGKPVSSRMMEFVAQQDDWMKRTRELRYLGWKIDTSRERKPNGRVESSYTLIKDKPWPAEPTRWIREFERKRAEKNRLES